MITLALIFMLQLPATVVDHGIVQPTISQLGGHDPDDINYDGSIRDRSGMPVRLTGKVIADAVGPWSVEVLLKDEGGFVIRKTQTFSNGVFRFDAVQLGNYWIQVADPRFKMANYRLILHKPEDDDKEVIVPLEPLGGTPSARVLGAMGQVLVEDGDVQKGIDQLLAIPVPNADDRYYLGLGFLMLGKFDAAQQQLAMAISMDPMKHPAAYVQLHDAYMRNGNPAAALAALETYLRLFPKDPNHKSVEKVAIREGLKKN